MSRIVTLGAGLSTTGQKSAGVYLGPSKELLNVFFEVGGTQTAWTAQLEGRWFTPNIDMLITDATDADLATFFAAAGELYVALGNRAPAVGDRFEVQGAGDVTDNALQTAKGSALVDGDIFMVSNIGTPAVVYVPNEGYTGLHTALTQASTLRIVHIIEAPQVRVKTSGTWTASTLVGCHVGY